MKMNPNHKDLQHPGQKTILISLLAFSFVTPALADGIYRDGVGAKSMSLGGADVAWTGDPLSSMSTNPAGLGFMQGGKLDLGASAILPEGHFSNRSDPNGSLSEKFSAFPEGAVGYRVGSSPVTLGLGFYPEAGLVGDWHYSDVPGGTGGNASYGNQEFKSEIEVFRTAFGLGVQLGPMFSIGASVGLIYNENKLQAPYIFQNQPALPPGFKTLLNLDTSGWGMDGSFGMQFRPNNNFTAGVSYHSETSIRTRGDASGNASAQLQALGLGAVPPNFHYDAEVDNTFPQSVSTGFAWKFQPQWTLSSQVDWVDWSTFDMLPVKLTNGSNGAINGVVGSTSLGDTIPLKWKDELVYRAGIEYAITDNLALRLGYIHGNSPVPTSTLTPLTAVITEDTITTGIGWQEGRWGVDLGYQYALPTTRDVWVSQLAAGEYNASSVKVSIHTFALTASIKF